MENETIGSLPHSEAMCVYCKAEGVLDIIAVTKLKCGAYLDRGQSNQKAVLRTQSPSSPSFREQQFLRP